MKQTDSYRHKGLRKQLVKELAEKGIDNPLVLQAIEAVPRHFFFEKAFLNHAYEDKAFKIGEGQTISMPYTVAYQSQLLEIFPKCKVLEIGTGSGYQSSVLKELGAVVYSIERHRSLHTKARKMLADMGYKVKLFLGDGTLGLPAFAPFDRIVVTAGAPIIPNSLRNQLSVGGILVIPVGDETTQYMHVIKRISETEFTDEKLSECAFVPLVGKEGWKG